MKIENPFHEGELQVQERAHERAAAKQNSVVISDSITKGGLQFIEKQSLAVFGSLDSDENVWASSLAGFMKAVSEKKITVDLSKTSINEEDPFWKNISNHPKIGMLVIDLATRRRLRVNGHIQRSNENLLELEVLESYPNCPKFIQRRNIAMNRVGIERANAQAIEGNSLGDSQQAIIKKADTFFVASVHSTRGLDASHRGGNSGFVHIKDNRTLRIPDYAGNSMFNTLGNFFLNPNAGLVFVDFENGSALQLTGTAEILWDQELIAEETGGTNRYWEFHIDRWLELKNAHQIEWSFLDNSPFNPKGK